MKKRRNYQKIEIRNSTSIEDIMCQYNVSKSTAWRALKRGYLCPNYHHKSEEQSLTHLPDEQILHFYEIASRIVRIRFKQYSYIYDDLIQNAVIYTLQRYQFYPTHSKGWLSVTMEIGMKNCISEYSRMISRQYERYEFTIQDLIDINNRLWRYVFENISLSETNEVEKFLNNKNNLKSDLKRKIKTLITEYQKGDQR